MPDMLLVFGPGYTAKPIMARAKAAGWRVAGTYRDEDKKAALLAEGYEAVAFGAGIMPPHVGNMHLLVTAAPGPDGDPFLPVWGDGLKHQPGLRSLIYLSSTNVYGDHGGEWVDETTSPSPSLDRGHRRLQAEAAWQHCAGTLAVRLFIVRLAGIYGPGRNALQSLRAGKARAIIKPGQVFSRIHVDDIAAAVWAAITSSHAGGIFNLADDMPCAPHLVVEEAANLLGVPAPQHENWETADMSPMARSFYLESKKVRCDRAKQELGLKLLYPDYKTGLQALLKAEKQLRERP